MVSSLSSPSIPPSLWTSPRTLSKNSLRVLALTTLRESTCQFFLTELRDTSTQRLIENSCQNSAMKVSRIRLSSSKVNTLLSNLPQSSSFSLKSTFQSWVLPAQKLLQSSAFSLLCMPSSHSTVSSVLKTLNSFSWANHMLLHLNLQQSHLDISLKLSETTDSSWKSALSLWLLSLYSMPSSATHWSSAERISQQNQRTIKSWTTDN